MLAATAGAVSVGAGVIVPWTVWQMTGDATVVRGNWPAMTRYLDWIRQQTGDTYAGQGPLTGDWPAPPTPSARDARPWREWRGRASSVTRTGWPRTGSRPAGTT
ncbi:hypothetical protein GCM10010094_76620 [Streptomyces flaveus]|uniref:Alpha-L-rhamnosidase six-hairpin glycosidase domain-containing protein n=1 Tax=Streptomyces flaveus TaxID=66370 RepID=A0A917VPC2_9ACTN|nr:hypothetical protein GCM10010094_76620 [Streptomyces flaveus]